MKKFIGILLLFSMLSGVSAAPVPRPSQQVADPGFVITDIMIYRPLGLGATVLGTAAFIGLSPLTALASIPRPHDAFEKTYKILIRTPIEYTFLRPVGNRDWFNELRFDQPKLRQLNQAYKLPPQPKSGYHNPDARRILPPPAGMRRIDGY